jgi:tetratricopeptide (TPR) repeat protein
VFALVSSLPAQPAPSAPPAKAPETAATATKAPDYSTQHAVIKQQRVTYRFEADGTGTRTEQWTILVQSEAGVQQLGQLQLGYNAGFQDIKINYVRVRKPDGSLVSADLATAVQDMTGPVARVAPMYTDYREKHVTVPSLRPGDTLEYETVIETKKPLAPGQFWMEHDFNDELIVLDAKLVVDVPKSRQAYLTTQPDFKDYETKESADRKVFTWNFKNLQTRADREQEDADKPAYKRKKRPVDEPPSVQLTTFSSWEEVGKWYSPLEQDRRMANDEMKAKVAELTRDRKTDIEKIRAVYDYVAKTYRYISLSFGIGRYQPHASVDVFKNEYGDCKDKHTLLAAMLKVLGYDMNTVLIGSQHKLDAKVPSPSQFDHVIGNVKLGNDVLWLDTTSEVAPMGMLVAPLRDKDAVQITSKAATSVVRTPTGIPVESFTTWELEGSVSELGKLTGHMRHTARGDQEFALRSALRRVPEASWNRIVEYMIRTQRLNGKASNIKVSKLDDTTQPVSIEYDLEVPNFYDWSAKESRFHLPLEIYSLPGLEDDDPQPLRIYGPITFSARTKITLPDSVTINPPVPVEIKRDYAQYSATAEFKDHVLTAERKMVLNVFEMPQSRARDFTAFVRVINSDFAQQAQITNSKSETLAGPKQAKTEELEDAAYNALQSRKFKLAADLYVRVTDQDPKHPRAWNNLGRAYAAMTQYDKAIAAYKKAIEVNAYDEWAYNNLGGVYEAQQKHTEAMEAYRKQIEVNPLDEFAHFSVGRLLMRDKKYDEAVVELQRASGIRPDDPGILQQLGEAYLNVNKTDQAMAAFDKALEKSPTPEVWNNVAYVLAKSKVRLDRAQQYAESAVSSTETLLRNLPAEQAEWIGTVTSASLASYWDTLGWVYFQQGDLDKAEKYLLASWQHSHHGEVGDHLGQLYEKRGDKENARITYTQALASPQRVPETEEHLKALTKGAKLKSDPLADFNKPIKLGFDVADAKAEMIVTFAGNGDVKDIKLLSGEQQFSSRLPELKKINFGNGFPNDRVQGFVRKGLLFCDKTCYVYLVPADVSMLGTTSEEQAASLKK